jgi:hypothetical protein
MKLAHFQKLSFVFFLLITGLYTQAQKFDSVLAKLDANYPQEKLYLHFDKATYNPGETIWFKAYLFSANALSLISKNVYAELIDNNGKILQRKVAPVIMSGAAAAFDLPTDLNSPVLYVRAYTRWMLNFDSSFYFVKPIPIVAVKDVASKKPAANQYSLQFFPEGGDLVQGIESKLAFKATDRNGFPFNVSGSIQNSKGQAITSFSSVHDGMGYFPLVPQPTDQYKAVWKDPAGQTHQTALPVAKKSGIVLQASGMGDAIIFSVKRPETAGEEYPSVYVVAQMQQQLLYRAKASLAKTSVVSGSIPVKEIPAGIVQITVFTENEKPLAERLVFVNHQDYYFITDLNAPLKGLNKRARNVIQIDVPDTIPCNLSLSITDAGANPSKKGEDDIFSTVLLTSDIKGYVHNPGYYFSSDVDSVAKHLDLVMMTNGWRRFKWEEVLAGNFPRITHAPEDYLTIEGKVNGLTKTELANRELTGFLVLPNNSQQILSVPVPSDGKFSIPGIFFYDTAKLYYQFNNDKDKILTTKALFDFKSNFLLTPPKMKTDSAMAARNIIVDTQMLARNRQFAQRNIQIIEDQKKVQTLASVEVVAKKKSKAEIMDEEYTSGFFKGGDGYTFVAEDDPTAAGSMSVLNYLQGKVAGLQITGSGSQMSLSWRGGTPSLYLNEMIGDVSLIQSLPMTDVAMVKVFRPPFFGGSGGGSGGAIAVYTKKGKAANDNVKGLDFARVAGYTPPRQFYSPDYSKADQAAVAEDYRTTLFWNPYVMTEKNSRRILFTFYNNDVTKKIRVVIEGVNADGKLTRMEKIIE